MSPLATLQLDGAPGAAMPEADGRRMRELLGGGGGGGGGSLDFASGRGGRQQRQFPGAATLHG